MRVCQKWFPETDGFFMDDRLVLQLEVLLKNIRNDWDFTIIITGQGEVRVGKSMIAMQIACYWAYEMLIRYKIKLPFNLKDNFVFTGSNLIKQGNYLGVTYPYSPLVFDEAGADLEGRKVMQGSTQDVLDFFRECGQYNMLNLLVLPEYFDLPKGIALSRSIFLIDVFYQADEDAIFRRGFFNFYSRRSKKWLYLKGKRDLNYSCVKSDFGSHPGKFFKFYPIPKKEYDLMKQEALKHRESKRRNKFMVQRDACIFLLCKEKQEKNIERGKSIMTQEQLSKRLEQLTGIFMDRVTISDSLRRMGAEEEDFSGENE
jgi:hypothetical protein